MEAHLGCQKQCFQGTDAGESFVQFSSVQSLSHVQLCDPMSRSTPGLPVHHQLQEFTQTHIHRVGDAIQPSHPLSSPSPPAPNPSQHQGLFQWVNSSHEVAKVLEVNKVQSLPWVCFFRILILKWLRPHSTMIKQKLKLNIYIACCCWKVQEKTKFQKVIYGNRTFIFWAPFYSVVLR